MQINGAQYIFITVASFFLLMAVANAEVLGKSTLETCVRDGTIATEKLDCSKRLVVPVTVASGQTLQSEVLQFSVGCVNSQTGQCPCPCNATVHRGCTCRDLAAPLKVSIAKSPLFATYPLTYVESFNWKPSEVYIMPKNNWKCHDDDYEVSPTCKWAYAPTGKKIDNSQGFCCECTIPQEDADTLGSSKEYKRAGLDCTMDWGSFIGIRPASAHCLTWNPQYYAAYKIGTFNLEFDITVTVGVPNADGSYSSEVLTLNPSKRSGISSGRRVAAKLIGDFAMYTQLPQFGNKLLLMPEPPGSQTGKWDEKMATNRSAWMLLDQNRITFSGLECDKVGTGYTAFRYQANKCARPMQTCLSNQLKDLWDEDEQRLRAGKAPMYRLSQYPGADLATIAYKGGPLSFALPVTSSNPDTLISLSVAADDVRLVQNRSPGRILDIKVCSFDRTNCGGFESGQRGLIVLNVTNTGGLEASYTLSMQNCTANIRQIEARKLSIAPGAVQSVEPPLDLYVEDPWAARNRSCLVTLYDSQAGVADSQVVFFYTDATKFDRTDPLGPNGTAILLSDKSKTDCNAACPNAFNVWCFVRKRCWLRLFRFLGVVAGAVVALSLLAAAVRLGWCSVLFGCCSACLRRSGGGGDAQLAKAPNSGETGKVGGGACVAPPPQAPPSAHVGRRSSPWRWWWWQQPFGGPPPQFLSKSWGPASGMGPQPSSYAPNSNRHGQSVPGRPVSTHPSSSSSSSSGRPPADMSRGTPSGAHHRSRGFRPVMSGLRGWGSSSRQGFAEQPCPAAPSSSASARLHDHDLFKPLDSAKANGSVPRPHSSVQYPCGNLTKPHGSVQQGQSYVNPVFMNF